MTLLTNNYFSSLKKVILKNEEKLIYFFLALTIFNNLSHFIRKNILGDRIDFWDFHVYWCTANKFIDGINPYGGNVIKECLSQFNFDLYFSYPPIILKSLSLLGYYDLNTSKIIWILIILISFFTIIFNLKKIYMPKNLIFFTLVLIFGGGGLIWSALLAGNISVILYAILSIGMYALIKKKLIIYLLSVSIISLAKFPFFIFFLLPIFLFGFKDAKKCCFFILITILIYFFQFIFDKELFLSFIKSTVTYKSDGFLLIHGTGIGIHGLLDLYQNSLYNTTNIELFNPSSFFSFFIHLSISGILFVSSYSLFKKKNLRIKQIKLLISFFIIIFLCCFPRISPYDFFIIIPAILYILKNSRIRKISHNYNFVTSLLIISFFSIYDSKYPAFFISSFLILCFYLEVRNKDPFYLKKI
ncbi:MAG: hypothetical protein CFH25_00018 [Alphaproteobacteria bacterium MarineAlpha6_Bin3]|nr:MAG: hypothetical protein CFH25_00018 [Alphaproteobacteria bacterium MarineAlpha6_Bin3]|tara:strand:+ start:11264 stop:12508 length:1245 start_codon:yes stop_codon:yes gene_type:complete